MEDSTHTNGAGSCRQGRAASRLTPGINIRAWLGSIPGLQPDGKRDRHPDSPRNPNPNRGCTAGVCLRARRETMRPAPSPRALHPRLRSPRLPPAAAGCTLQPGESPPSGRPLPASGLVAPEVSRPSAFRHRIGCARELQLRPFPRVL